LKQDFVHRHRCAAPFLGSSHHLHASSSGTDT
jgi:hypothetical protein